MYKMTLITIDKEAPFFVLKLFMVQPLKFILWVLVKIKTIFKKLLLPSMLIWRKFELKTVIEETVKHSVSLKHFEHVVPTVSLNRDQFRQ